MRGINVSSAGLLKDALREKNIRNLAKIHSDLSIKKIAMVGARGVSELLSATDFSHEPIDFFRLKKFLAHCVENGIPLAETLEIDEINLAEKRDFLNEDYSYDAVVICYIPLECYAAPAYCSLGPAFFATSPLVQKKSAADVWRERIISSNAKLCISFACSHVEVNVQTIFAKNNDFKQYGFLWNGERSLVLRDRYINEVRVNRFPGIGQIHCSDIVETQVSIVNAFQYFYPHEKETLISYQMATVVSNNYVEDLSSVDNTYKGQFSLPLIDRQVEEDRLRKQAFSMLR